MTNTQSETAQDLRKRAEEKFRMAGTAALQPLRREDTEKLPHELQVHQIEYEIRYRAAWQAWPPRRDGYKW